MKKIFIIALLAAPVACFVGSRTDLDPAEGFDAAITDDAGDGGIVRDAARDTGFDAHMYANKATHCVPDEAGTMVYSAPGGNDGEAGIFGETWPMPQAVSLGGPTLKHPLVVPVSFLEDDQRTIDEWEDFCASVMCTPYWDAISKDYGVGRGSATAGVRLPEAAWKKVDDAGIAKWLRAKLDAKDPAFPQPTADTIYAIIVPYETDITLQGSHSCQGFGGYHSSTTIAGGKRVAYAVLPQCAGFDDLSNATSHELIEAATDPYPQQVPAYGQTDDGHLPFSAIGGGEVGDLCEFNDDARFTPQGFPWVVQRSFSNSESFLGRDPCAPSSSAPWIVAVPDQPDVIHFFNRAIKGIKMAPSDVRTIPLRLHSTSSQNWGISVRDISVFQGGPAHLQFSLSTGSGKDGDVVNLKITKLSNNNNYGIELFFITSSGNGKTSMYWAATGSQ
jgi:hypothetical protein